MRAWPWIDGYFARALWLLWLTQSTAGAAEDLAWQHGQRLYRHGWDGQAACARCHGWRGEGREEGGLRAPALAGKPERQFVQRALIEGVGSRGTVLHPLMPRYHLDAATLEDLLAYLALIGTDTPGVSESVVRVGVVLPPTVYGAAVRAGLNRAFDQVLVYGRKLELVVNAVPTDVFVQVGNLPANSMANADSENGSPPDVGSLPVPGVADFSDTASQGRFRLVPSLPEQARMLLAQAVLAHVDGKTVERLTLVYEVGNDPGMMASVDALREQAHVQHLQLREQIGPAPAPLSGDVVIFLGSGTHLRAFMEAGGAQEVYANAIHVGPSALRLPAAQASRLRLLLPWRTMGTRVDLTDAYADAAYASGLVLVEALKRCGRQLGRAQLLQQLESLRNFAVPAFGRIDLRADQHFGGHGAQLLGVDSVRGVFRVLREVSGLDSGVPE